MIRYIDIAGNRYGRLLVLRKSGNRSSGATIWIVECDCGARRVVTGYDLRKGKIVSCGCLRKERTAIRSTKHGQNRRGKRSREYQAWVDMKDRCGRPTNKNYKYYGGRGITVCDRWKDDFVTFYLDMGRCPSGLTLERINNDKGYTPKNCKWATLSDQAKNRRPRRRNAIGQYAS